MTYRSTPGAGPPEDLEALDIADFRRRMPEDAWFVLDSARPIPSGVVFVPSLIGVFASLAAVLLLLPFVVVPCAVPFVHLSRGRSSTRMFVVELVFCLLVAAILALLLWIFGSNLVRAIRHALGRERRGLYWTSFFLLYRESSSILVCPLEALESLEVVPTVKRLPRGGRAVRIASTRSRSGRKVSLTFDRAHVLEDEIEALRARAAAHGQRTA
ncbi:MAG: hypothetical protein IPM79_35055 [Polyangiaceae bacterium]|nr:hypothetical protein [Polyangiaceae bacterium]